MRKIAPAPIARRTGRSKRSRVLSPPATGNGGTKSKLGQKKEMLGPAGGTDYRPKAPIKVEVEDGIGVLYSRIGKEWKRAGYHSHFREQLILKDAQQPGAPAFQEGMSLDRTSYSPITRGWTDDPHSMRDSKGRQAFLMPEHPADWKHNPKCDYLMFDGLILLDQNDRPMKDYPGAPLTLGNDQSELPGYLIIGLQRYFGMTFSDMAARTPPVRVMPNGTRDKRTTTVSERGQRYMDRYGMRPWHKRKARNANRGQIAAQPGPQDEEINATDSIPDLQPMPYLDEDESANNHLSNLFSSPPVANAPPFREANLATQTANEVAPENIYSPGYPVEFAPQNIYPPNGNIYSPGYPFEFAPRSVSPLNADTDFSGDPFGYAPQNIFNDYINDDFWNVENFSPFSLGF